MRLQEFTPNSFGRLTINKGKFVYLRKSGMVAFSPEAIKFIGLKEFDKISFFQDNDLPRNWYFAKSDNGFYIKKAYEKRPGLSFHSKGLYRRIKNGKRAESVKRRTGAAIEYTRC